MTLKNRIKQLEEQLEHAKKHTYIHETHTLSCHDGELTIGYGDCEDERWLVINVEQLYKDLPFLVKQVVEENKKMQEMHLSCLKDSLEKI
tara:strand:- start:5362 stop:5631 length:270 start_codon:yes stop_codon:yes gene_type:complete